MYSSRGDGTWSYHSVITGGEQLGSTADCTIQQDVLAVFIAVSTESIVSPFAHCSWLPVVVSQEALLVYHYQADNDSWVPWGSVMGKREVNDPVSDFVSQVAIDGDLLYAGKPLGRSGGEVSMYNISKAGAPMLVATLAPPHEKLKM